MTDLIVEMVVWLLLALVFGFFIGWIFTRAKEAEKYSIERDSLSSSLSDRDEMLGKLEKKFRNQKIMFDKLSADYEFSEEQVAEKTSLLTQIKANLEKTKMGIDSGEELTKKNKSLIQQTKNLEFLDKKRRLELEEFEHVLIKAEVAIENNDEEILKLEDTIETVSLENEEKTDAIALYIRTIADFEEELRLYTSTKEDSEFVISKDQFVKIEEQLIKYQNEIELLKKKNSEFTKS